MLVFMHFELVFCQKSSKTHFDETQDFVRNISHNENEFI